jgi:tetratricopeptide (TPR) repeat protein
MMRIALALLLLLPAFTQAAVVTGDEAPTATGHLPGLEEGGFLGLPMADTNSELALLLMKAVQNAPKEARVRDAERLLALDPNDPTAQRELARLYLANNRLDEAANLFWRVTRAQPSDLNRMEEFGFVLLACGDHAQGLKVYQELYRVGHRTPVVLFNLAAASHHQGRRDEAQDLMQKFLATQPNHLRGLYNLGVMQYAAGAHEKAAATWQSALQQQPRQIMVLAALARLQRDLGQQELFEKSRQALLNSLGEAPTKALLDYETLPTYLLR